MGLENKLRLVFPNVADRTFMNYQDSKEKAIHTGAAKQKHRYLSPGINFGS
jgi:hypothetical protein